MIGFEPNLRIDDFALDTLLNMPNGDVGRWLRKKGRTMQAAAKRDAGRKTGALKLSIYRNHSRVPRGQMMVIGSPLHYAEWHHEGTHPHGITGKNGGLLVFTHRGKVVRTRHVNHPGGKSNKFLVAQFKYLFTP